MRRAGGARPGAPGRAQGGGGGIAHTVRVAESWAELFALAAPAARGVAFVDPHHGGPLAAAHIRRLRERFPALEVVAYADFAGRPACDAFSMALLGVRAVVAGGGGGEADALAQALNRTPLDALAGRPGQVLPAGIHRWLTPVLCAPGEPRTVPALAARRGAASRGAGASGPTRTCCRC